MCDPDLLICRWPAMPALPPVNRAVILRVATPESRPSARAVLRKVLRQVVAAWSNCPQESLPLVETARGPVLQSKLGGCTLDISLSYTTGEGWVGLLLGGRIGVDVMRVKSLPDAANIARHYLAPAIAAGIESATDPARAFAIAWTEREARIKCLKLDLTEWTAARAHLESTCVVRSLALRDHLIGAVAVG